MLPHSHAADLPSPTIAMAKSLGQAVLEMTRETNEIENMAAAQPLLTFF